MIDTNKYEGHTPGPWQASHDRLEYGWIVNNHGWRVYVGEHEKRAEIQNSTFDHDDLSEANARLIADAPLLLAEVKRLHERLMLAESALGEVRAYYESGQGDLGEILEHYRDMEGVEMPNAFDEVIE